MKFFFHNLHVLQINGERHPGEVFKDFREAVLKILGMQDNPPVFSNGPQASLPNDLTTELPKVVSIIYFAIVLWAYTYNTLFFSKLYPPQQ